MAALVDKDVVIFVTEEDQADVPRAEGHAHAEDAPAAKGPVNYETGEIDWDCPCLGNAAKGPCGDEFKAAFSCFVFSKAEDKGADCLEQFRGMQTCFNAHPEYYKPVKDDDDEAAEVSSAPAPAAEPVSATDSLSDSLNDNVAAAMEPAGINE